MSSPLKVTNAHAGKLLRAKVTYKTQEDDTDTEADESTYPTWVEYTEVLTVSGDVTNNNPCGIPKRLTRSGWRYHRLPRRWTKS